MSSIKYPLILLLIFSSCNKKAGQNNPVPTADELQGRIEKILQRISTGQEPAITEEFLLAELDPDSSHQRRFTEFTGDQIGRYLTLMAYTDSCRNNPRMNHLIKQISSCQKSDGRFGNESLEFKPEKLGKDHMALLWGNGRLLAGLMDYYFASGDTSVLIPATKLGNFLTDITDVCVDPKVAVRFRNENANGYICFTQLTEGLVKLYKGTGNKRYLVTAEKVYTLLPPMGRQHSHGYITTLRGVLLLYEVTGDSVYLKFTKTRFDEIIASPDYLITGGIPEFFGSNTAQGEIRDEGCAEADFVMMSLSLWKTTGGMQYLESAEKCLVNHLFFNQFCSGDFGHHPYKPGFGFIPSQYQGKAWWCCDYHGYNALKEAERQIITASRDTVYVNLFFRKNFEDSLFHIQLEPGNTRLSWDLYLDKGKKPNVLSVRVPGWSRSMIVYLNNDILKPENIRGHIYLNDLKTIDHMHIEIKTGMYLVSEDKHQFSLTDLTSNPVKAALFFGPWLMCADDAYSPQFLAEPSMGNVIYLAPLPVANGENKITGKSNYLIFDYTHEGFYGMNKVTLRPISETSLDPPSNVRIWLNFASEK